MPRTIKLRKIYKICVSLVEKMALRYFVKNVRQKLHVHFSVKVVKIKMYKYFRNSCSGDTLYL